MSQRESGYNRVAFDQYETPAWVTHALVPHLPKRVQRIQEPACGTGKMVEALQQALYFVDGFDIQGGLNFFVDKEAAGYDAIVTNPPYSHAAEFVEHALSLMQPQQGVVAMLLRTDFDHAEGRARLFSRHPAFAKKVVLTKRIVWFEREGRKAAPSFNHAWFVWDWKNTQPPIIAYDIQEAV